MRERGGKGGKGGREVPRELADATVLDEHKQVLRLGDLWSTRPVVLTFVRHFGCVFCREQVTELRGDLDRIHAAGAELVVIGNGAPNFIHGFREVTGYDGPLYTDPSRASYKAAEMKRGWSTFLTPKLITNAARALVHGNMQGSVQGDPAQQGGTLVIAPPGKIVFHFVSDTGGDHAKTEDVLAALAKLERRPTN
jgi:peroxiredoxin